ncbi:hypothetical protein EG328_000849 [Venturia inaequalis]|uniref:Uncharacterized protein n=1 Tax=Venturia inaequalis TaxID=5025 RepID=A0A8H3VE22_VENIN|nr:hypothetical protein EG328_000849 [Venturia inaequalis]KAE9986791.1 hypothetical protein EG327_004160 [Venturia inaequalis]RDI78819.1 Alpha-amylase [Venturia inaequalis]
MQSWISPPNSPAVNSPASRIDSVFTDYNPDNYVSPFLKAQNQKKNIFRPLVQALVAMNPEYALSDSDDSHISFRPDQKRIAFHQDAQTPSLPGAVEMQRQEYTQQWPPWLRVEVADRRRQLDASREMDHPPPDLTMDHFGIAEDHFEVQHTLVANWLNALPERLIDGWETVLRDEVEETFVKRYSKGSLRRSPRIRSEGDDDDAESEYDVNGTHGEDYSIVDDAEMEAGCYQDNVDEDQEMEDDFLRKVLLGRKRLMQAEISVKRLKMGLKYVANGMCEEFGDAVDAQRTRNLLAAVNSTFEEVVRKRLSTATVKGLDPREDYRARLQDLHERDPSLMSRIYSEREIRELKNMVEDILSMDGRRLDGEGKQWFMKNLPRLLELREDMALAEKEMERSKQASNEVSSDASEYDDSNPGPRSEYFADVSVWDMYYMQYCWIQAAFEYRPKGSWEGFEISPEEESDCEDWQLRIEQRVWLQEQFGLNMGTMPWTPFRQAHSTFYV